MATGSAATALLRSSCGGSSHHNGGQRCTTTGDSTSGTAKHTLKVFSDPNTIGKYDPATASAKVGDTVAWDFQDSTGVQHSVSEDNGTFESCLQNSGAKFMVTFSKAGDFKYHCQIHAQMLGEIKVG